MFASQSSLVYLIKPLAIRSMAGLCHLLCGTLSMVREAKLSYEAYPRCCSGFMKSGTHFDDHFTYDSKNVWTAVCTSNEQHSMIFQGLSQRALSQLDKHSEELALQRVSDPVISNPEIIFCFM